MSIGLLGRHVVKATALAMLGALVIVVFLQLVFNYLAELGELDHHYTALQALYYVLWNTPQQIVTAIPFAVLMGGVVGLGTLASHSELLVMRASGVSLWKIVSWAMLPALVLVCFNLVLMQWILPYGHQQATVIKHASRNDIGEVRGYWTREGNQFVYIDYANSQGQLHQVQTLQIDQNYRIRTLRYGQSAQFRHDHWQLQQVEQVDIAPDGRATRHYFASQSINLALQPKFIHLVTTDPEQLSPSELIDFMQYMQRYSQVPTKYQLAFWQLVATPFALMALLVLACSFVFGPLRQHSMSFRIVLALFFGLGFHYMRSFFAYASLVYAPSAIWFVFLPIVIVFMVGTYLLHRAR